MTPQAACGLVPRSLISEILNVPVGTPIPASPTGGPTLTQPSDDPSCIWHWTGESESSAVWGIELGMMIEPLMSGGCDNQRSLGNLDPSLQGAAPTNGCVVSLAGGGFGIIGPYKGAVVEFQAATPGATPTKVAQLWHDVVSRL